MLTRRFLRADGYPMAYDVSKRPGVWVRAQARRREQRVWALIALVFLVALCLVVSISFGVRSALVALVGLIVILELGGLARHEIGPAGTWLRGARSEEAVGEALAGLGRDGYTVLHDIRQEFEGNIDHLVSGPSGVYMVETKHRRYETDQLRKAKRQAAKLHDELGVWVTPVICLDKRRDRDPFRHHGVWIVCRTRLVTWMKAQRNPVLDFDRLAAFADRL